VTTFLTSQMDPIDAADSPLERTEAGVQGCDSPTLPFPTSPASCCPPLDQFVYNLLTGIQPVS
jgi:hypothetical protein